MADIAEGKMKEIATDIESMDNGNFVKKYGAPKESFTKGKNYKAPKPVCEEAGTEPKNEKQRKLAARKSPKDKITQADVLDARGVFREAVADVYGFAIAPRVKTQLIEEIKSSLNESVGSSAALVETDEGVYVVEGVPGWSTAYAKLRVYGRPIDPELINERLTDDAKEAIQMALGPKSYASDPKFYITGERTDNPLRRGTKTARVFIKHAKMDPDNIAIPDHIKDYHKKLRDSSEIPGGLVTTRLFKAAKNVPVSHIEGPIDELPSNANYHRAKQTTISLPVGTVLTHDQPNNFFHGYHASIGHFVIDDEAAEQHGIEGKVYTHSTFNEAVVYDTPRESRLRGHVFALKDRQGNKLGELHPHDVARVQKLKDGETHSFENGKVMRNGDNVHIHMNDGSKHTAKHEQFTMLEHKDKLSSVVQKLNKK